MRKSAKKSRDVCYGPGKFTIRAIAIAFLKISLRRSIKIYHVHFPVFSSESYLQLQMEEVSQEKSIENCTDKTE